MPYTFEELAERERRRWLRPAAHLFVRPDARGSVDCDAARLRERLLHPDHELWNFHLQTDAQRRFPGEHAVAEGGHGLAANLPRLQARHDSLRLAFMELQHERRRKRELERAQAERLKRRYDAAWDKFIAAFNRHWDTCCNASFDPNQPRVPAGNPDGGQWRSGGGDAGAGVGVDRGKPGGINDPRVLSDATPGNDWIPGAQYAQNDRSHHPVDLSENTHVMQQHVRSPDYVL